MATRKSSTKSENEVNIEFIDIKTDLQFFHEEAGVNHIWSQDPITEVSKAVLPSHSKGLGKGNLTFDVSNFDRNKEEAIASKNDGVGNTLACPPLRLHFKRKNTRENATAEYVILNGTKEPANDVHHCDICRQKCSTTEQLHTHRLTHTTDTKYTCLICGSLHDTKQSIDSHINSPKHKRSKITKSQLFKRDNVRHKRLIGRKSSLHETKELEEGNIHGSTHERFKQTTDISHKRVRNRRSLLHDTNDSVDGHIDSSSHERFKLGADRLVKSDFGYERVSGISDLDRYRRGSSDAKQYDCDVCCKVFQNNVNMDRHRRSRAHRANLLKWFIASTESVSGYDMARNEFLLQHSTNNTTFDYNETDVGNQMQEAIDPLLVTVKAEPPDDWNEGNRTSNYNMPQSNIKVENEDFNLQVQEENEPLLIPFMEEETPSYASTIISSQNKDFWVDALHRLGTKHADSRELALLYELLYNKIPNHTQTSNTTQTPQANQSNTPTNRPRRRKKSDLSKRRIAAMRARLLRQQETPAQTQARLETHARASVRRRLAETPEESRARRAANAKYTRLRRKRETAAQAQARRERDAFRAQLKRQLETPEQRQQRRDSEKYAARLRRLAETPEATELRREADKCATRLRRLAETPEQTQARQEAARTAKRVFMRLQREQETPEAARARRQANAERNRIRRQLETPEKREARLAANRLAKRRRLELLSADEAEERRAEATLARQICRNNKRLGEFDIERATDIYMQRLKLEAVENESCKSEDSCTDDLVDVET